MVLPRPTSSAMKRFARGSSSAFLSGVSWWSHELDAGAERRLEEPRVGGGDGAPLERVQVGARSAAADRGARRRRGRASRGGGRARRARAPTAPRARGLGRRRRGRRAGRASPRLASRGGATSSTSHCRWRHATMSPRAACDGSRRTRGRATSAAPSPPPPCASRSRAASAGRARPESSRPCARQAARSSSRPRFSRRPRKRRSPVATRREICSSFDFVGGTATPIVRASSVRRAFGSAASTLCVVGELGMVVCERETR